MLEVGVKFAVTAGEGGGVHADPTAKSGHIDTASHKIPTSAFLLFL